MTKKEVASDSERAAALAGFVSTCILAERKDRFFGFAKSHRGLTKWLKQLDHFQNYLDLGKAIHLDVNTGDLVEVLGLPAQRPVFVWSTLREYRAGCVLSLQLALEDVFLMGNGAIVSSMNTTDRFWFYLGEERSH